MLNIGPYRIAFGRTFVAQTSRPTTVRCFLCFWILKEAKSTDINKEQKFPLGTPMIEEGRKYYYMRAGKTITVGGLATFPDKVPIKKEKTENAEP